MSRVYVRGCFNGSKTQYTYTAEGSVDELKDFTHAVVMSPSTGLTVIEVNKIDVLDESNYEGEYKSVVALFDMHEYNKTLERDERRKALEKELRARVAKRSIVKNFESLLNDDTEGMKMLEEFKSLQS